MKLDRSPAPLPSLAAGLVAAALSAACASTGAVPRPFPTPGGPPPAAAAPTPETPEAIPPAAIVDAALALRGRPYRNGGSDPHGFDCSGFTQYVFGRNGVQLPREVRDQFTVGTKVATAHIAAGDLLFFKTTRRGVSHVGIALDGDRFVHAPSSNGVVRIDRLSESYWSRHFVAAHRVN